MWALADWGSMVPVRLEVLVAREPLSCVGTLSSLQCGRTSLSGIIGRRGMALKPLKLAGVAFNSLVAVNAILTVVAVGLIALLLNGCEGGNRNGTQVGEPRGSSASDLPAVQSDCVDANQSDVSAPELLRMIGDSATQIFAGETAPEEQSMVEATRDGWYTEADQTSKPPWGDIPHNGLAMYARQVCDLVPAINPNTDQYPHKVERVQKTHGAIFMEAWANCRTWNQQKPGVDDWSAFFRPLRDRAAAGDPASKQGLLILKYICPQLDSGS